MTSILDIDVSTVSAGRYKVAVLESPAGEASATFELDAGGIISKTPDLQATILASGVSSRKLAGRAEASVRAIGQLLFDALFSAPEVAGVYRASSAIARERGDSLRLVLRLGAPELAALPWECLFDQSIDSFVSRREPLVRYVPVPATPPPLKVAAPLRVLALVSSPRSLAALDVQKEKQSLTRALSPLVDDHLLTVHWVERATWSSVHEALLSGTWHVVHFIGHGGFDVERSEGVLLLEDDQGWAHQVAAESFVDLLREAQPMPRLVVLNSCESSTSGSTDIFSGSAATLVRAGVSAVTAMQFEISDNAAIAFCHGFYTAIGRGRGVDEAVRSGRVAILGLGEGSLEWITPTLYLRGRETQLFSLPSSRSADRERAVDDYRARAEEAVNQGDTATAILLYDNVLAEDPEDAKAQEGRALRLAESRGGGGENAPAEAAGHFRPVPPGTMAAPALPPATPTGAAKRSITLPAAGLMLLVLAIPAIWVALRSDDTSGDGRPSAVSLPVSEPLSDTELIVARNVDGRNWELYRADTLSPRPGARLTDREGSDSQPVLSPDRRTVIYLHDDENSTASLRVAGAADMNGDRVLFGLPADCSTPLRPAWNPADPSLLAIGCRDAAERSTLRLMRTDGTVVSTVAPPAGRPRTGHVAFSADGRRIGFWASTDATADDGRLYTVAVTGGVPETVFPSQDAAAAHDAQVAYSPDGEHLAFTRSRGGQLDIFVAGTDGSGVTPLTSAGVNDDSPTWSPDGEWIAFRSAAPTPAWPGRPLARIWLTSSTRDDPRLLWAQEAPEQQRQPAWR